MVSTSSSSTCSRSLLSISAPLTRWVEENGHVLGARRRRCFLKGSPGLGPQLSLSTVGCTTWTRHVSGHVESQALWLLTRQGRLAVDIQIRRRLRIQEIFGDCWERLGIFRTESNRVTKSIDDWNHLPGQPRKQWNGIKVFSF